MKSKARRKVEHTPNTYPFRVSLHPCLVQAHHNAHSKQHLCGNCLACMHFYLVGKLSQLGKITLSLPEFSLLQTLVLATVIGIKKKHAEWLYNQCMNLFTLIVFKPSTFMSWAFLATYWYSSRDCLRQKASCPFRSWASTFIRFSCKNELILANLAVRQRTVTAVFLIWRLYNTYLFFSM